MARVRQTSAGLESDHRFISKLARSAKASTPDDPRVQFGAKLPCVTVGTMAAALPASAGPAWALYWDGRRSLRLGDPAGAADTLGDALAALTEELGPLALRCAPVYSAYGAALVELHK